MVESPASDVSHETSGAEDNGTAQSKVPAFKDRQCPYCHQAFTSSSLGRHLDQFLNKKKPDGIHNVEEIRRTRSGITRRLARNGAKHESDERTNSPAPSTSNIAPAHEVESLNTAPPGGVRNSINRSIWQSTGVINGLPETTSLYPVQAQSLHGSTPTISTPAGTKRTWTSFAKEQQREVMGHRGDLGNERDTARALELALREVLESLQASVAQIAPPPTPFDFDFKAQTFASLLIHMLPVPPTLWSPTPFDAPGALPVSTPGHAHLGLLRVKVTEKINKWKWMSLRQAQSTNTYLSPHATTIGEETDYLSHLASTYTESSASHIEAAFGAWSTLSMQQQAETWKIELIRAYAREQADHETTREEVKRLKAEVEALQRQIEQLGQCQWPREMALWPPERTYVPREVMTKLPALGGDKNLVRTETEDDDSIGDKARSQMKFDYDRLVNKWKKVVREDTVRNRGLGTPGPGTVTMTAGSPAGRETSMINGSNAQGAARQDTLPPRNLVPGIGGPPIYSNLANATDSKRARTNGVTDGLIRAPTANPHDHYTNAMLAEQSRTTSIGSTGDDKG